MCPAACPYLVLFCMPRACCASESVQTGSNRMKPGKTQEKSAPSAVVAGYINRAATAIAITTVLRSLQSTWTEHYRALQSTSRCKYILYIIFFCTKLIHRNHNRSPIFAHLFRRITMKYTCTNATKCLQEITIYFAI